MVTIRGSNGIEPNLFRTTDAELHSNSSKGLSLGFDCGEQRQ